MAATGAPSDEKITDIPTSHRCQAALERLPSRF